MATYDDALNSALISYSEYRNVLDAIDRRIKQYGDIIETMGSFKALKNEAEYMGTIVSGQIKLISEMYGKQYFQILKDLKEQYDENI